MELVEIPLLIGSVVVDIIDNLGLVGYHQLGLILGD
jgi:hypothetical protein